MYPPLDKEGNKKSVSLYVCLCWRVRNQIGRYFREQQRVVLLEGNGERSLEDLWEYVLYECSTRRYQAEEESDRECNYHDLCDDIRRVVADHQDLRMIVEMLIETPDIKPGEMAAALGLTPREVYKSLRRLRRIVQDNLE